MWVIVWMDASVAGAAALHPPPRPGRHLLLLCPTARAAAAPVPAATDRVILIATGIGRCSPTHAATARPAGTIGGRARSDTRHRHKVRRQLAARAPKKKWPESIPKRARAREQTAHGRSTTIQENQEREQDAVAAAPVIKSCQSRQRRYPALNKADAATLRLRHGRAPVVGQPPDRSQDHLAPRPAGPPTQRRHAAAALPTAAPRRR